MYYCLIVDDKYIERDMLSLHLGQIPHIQVVAVCSDGISAAEVLQKQKVDIVFSDIEMPGLSGIGLLKSLTQAPVFIFVSAYAEYAAESFNLDVIDYIVKPATFERVLKAVNKATEYLDIKNQVPVSAEDNFLTVAPEMIGMKTNPEEHFFIRDTIGYTKINIADVAYIESMGSFSKIYTAQNKSYIALVNLKNIEKQVSFNIFRRVHKQYIVSLMHIRSVLNASITLTNGFSVPLSATYRQQIHETVVDKNLLSRFGDE
ncbi:MAG: response regulator transcription factor [Bacteroidota bacterium]